MQPTPPPPPPTPTPGPGPGQTPAPGNPGQAPPRPPGAPAQPPQQQQQGIASKISFTKPNIGPGAPPIGAAPAAPAPAAPAPPREPSLMPSSPNDSGMGMQAAAAAAGAAAAPKITMFGREKRHEEAWSRTPNTTGSGAIHVKTFHCKLTEDALLYMDQTVNEWLDAHPQYEVKFVSSSIGTMTGKLKEPALICQVWV